MMWYNVSLVSAPVSVSLARIANSPGMQWLMLEGSIPNGRNPGIPEIQIQGSIPSRRSQGADLETC